MVISAPEIFSGFMLSYVIYRSELGLLGVDAVMRISSDSHSFLDLTLYIIFLLFPTLYHFGKMI